MKKVIKEKIEKQKNDFKKELNEQKSKSKKEINEFKKFAFSNNIIDMSVGVVIGTGFKAIVTSFTNDIIMPLISLLTKKIDFTNLFISLDGNNYDTLEIAKTAGASTINYGVLITSIIDFLITSLCIYFVVKQIEKIKGKVKKDDNKPKTKKCEYCKSEIDIAATRCPHCTSILIKEENISKENA